MNFKELVLKHLKGGKIETIPTADTGDKENLIPRMAPLHNLIYPVCDTVFETCKEKTKCDPYTGKNKVNRNSLRRAR